MAIKVMVEDIPVEVKRKQIKNMYLYVKSPNGDVVVSVPASATTTDINKFVLPRIDWIRRNRMKFLNRDIPKEKTYDEGTSVFVAGTSLTIKIEYAANQYAHRDGDYLILGLRNGHNPERRERVVREFMREDLSRRIERFLPEWEDRTGLKASTWQIKDMETRWGTCNMQEKRLWFNLKLAYMPDEFLEYVILHEVAHLKIAGHGADFSAFLDKYMIDWRDIKKTLNARYAEFL